MANIFTGKVYLLVTGASRGIGKQIAQTFGQLLNENSTVLLLSRNAENLKQTVEALPKSLNASYKSVDFRKTNTAELEVASLFFSSRKVIKIQEGLNASYKNVDFSKNITAELEVASMFFSSRKVMKIQEGLNASYQSVDFSKTNTAELEGLMKESLKNEKPESFNQAIIVHAAAMANFSQLTTEMTDFEDWHRSFDLNMFSPAVLNGIFMKTFNEKNTKKYVVNISSYWGLRPDVYVGSYCAAKAAKDMFFKVFALENPDVNVLNYLPGFAETDMFYEALKESKNEELKAKLKDLIENKKFVTPAQTADCLVKVLKKQNYKSGDHVDYYKLPSECITV